METNMMNLEEADGKNLQDFENGAILRSKRGDIVAIKKSDLYWELLSLAQFRGEPGDSRYVAINFNEERMGSIFGPDKHDYFNYLKPGDTAGKHYHRITREIFFAPYLEHSLTVKLKDIRTMEEIELKLDAGLVEFEGKRWIRMIMIPEGIAHSVHNPNDIYVPIFATTTYEHGDADAISFEM